MTRADVSEDRRRELADLAEAVADTCMGGGRVEPAVALESEGVRVVYGDFADAFDGLLEHRTSGFVAYVNLPRNGGSPGAARARFTLAHEAGHYFIDEHRHALRSGQPPHGSATDFASHLRVEVEADLFAAHLLMPAARVRKRFRVPTHATAPRSRTGAWVLYFRYGRLTLSIRRSGAVTWTARARCGRFKKGGLAGGPINGHPSA